MLSSLYHLGLIVDRAVRSRNRHAFPIPVISVGNITVGGSGKTPLMIKLARDLQSLGVKPAILTRGYRGFGHSLSVQGNDEVLLMRRYLANVSIGVGPDRIKVGRALLAQEPFDAFLLDDGFQHWPLERVLDVVCIDCTNPFSSGRLLPFGRLREPLSALRRANVIVLTRTELADERALADIKDQIKAHAPDAICLESRFESALYRWDGEKCGENLTGRRVVALSAIGNPDAFERALTLLGARVISCRFEDHHEYDAADVTRALFLSGRDEAQIITTEKDQVKLEKLILPNLQEKMSGFGVLKIELKFDASAEKEWMRILKEKMNK